MKRTILFTVVFSTMMFVAACSEKNEKITEDAPITEQPVHTKTAKKEVAALMDNLHNSLKSKKADDFKNLLDEDGLYCGTDPTEIYDRDKYASVMAETLNNPELGTVAYTVDTREIKVDEDGEGATILEQYKIDLFSPEIPWRLVSHAVKDEGAWKIDFLSFSLVPTNQQQERINEALHTKG